MVEAVAAGELASGLQVINAAIDGGADPRQLARQVVDYLRNLMLVRMGNAGLVEAGAEARAIMARQAERLEMPSLLRAIRAFNTAANDARGGWQPQLPLELAMVECVTAPVPAAVAAAPAAVAAAQAPRPTGRSAPAAHAAPEPAPARPSQPARSEPKRAPERVDAPASTATSARAPAREAKAPAAPEAPALSDEAEPTTGGTRTAAELKSDWGRFVHLMRERDKLTEALLNSCTVLGLEGQVLRLSTNEFVFKKISSNSATREVIEALLGEVLGYACTVKFEVSGRAARSARADDIPEDGLVATALDLGGEIVDE